MLGAGISALLLAFIQLILVDGHTYTEKLRAIAEDNVSNIVALVVTSGLAIGFYHLFVKEEESLGEIQCVDPQSCRVMHADAVKTSTFWYAEGHIARWVRENVLPEFARTASQGYQIHEVTIAILDPAKEDLCSLNVTRRRDQYARRDTLWDIPRFQAEICATVIASILLRAKFDRLRFNIYLKSDSPAMRSDISAKAAFLTLDDALAPAIVVEPGSKQYKILLTYFQDYARNQPGAVRLDIDAAAEHVKRTYADAPVPVADYATVARLAGLEFMPLADANFCMLVHSCSKVLQNETR